MPDSVDTQPDDAPDRRAQLRDRNRRALIEATLDCVAEIGYARTSVSTIIDKAGLSRGMIHLHFNGKDGLMDAAVQHASDLYYQNLYALLEKVRPSAWPQERIEAVIRSDLSETILNQYNVRIWYGFRGEARDRESIRTFSDTRDSRLRGLLFEAFTTIAVASGVDDPAQTARDAAHGTLAFLEGMWADYLIHPDAFDREEACRIIFRFLSALFPKHFDLAGATPDAG